MDARELRIGNLLQRIDGSIFTVTSKDFERIEEIKKDLHPKPIPLTEEWLLKFGFEKIAGCFDYGKLSILLEKSIAHPKGRVFYNSWCIGEEAPLHVHQLQNLYFTLTGQELTLNENYDRQTS